MPTYEYQCTANGNRFELWQEVGAEAPPCPECGAPSKKVFGVPRVIFKGSGFYLTDMRAEQSKGSSKKSDAESGSSGASETTSSTASTSSDAGSSSTSNDAKPSTSNAPASSTPPSTTTSS